MGTLAGDGTLQLTKPLLFGATAVEDVGGELRAGCRVVVRLALEAVVAPAFAGPERRAQELDGRRAARARRDGCNLGAGRLARSFLLRGDKNVATKLGDKPSRR